MNPNINPNPAPNPNQFNGYQPPMAPQFSYQPPRSGGKGLCIASLILSILALIAFWFPFVSHACFLFGILAIIFGVMGRNRIPVGFPGRGIGTAGLVIGIIATVFSTVTTICYTILCIEYGSILRAIDYAF